MPALSDPSQRDPADQALMHPTVEGRPALPSPLRLGVMASGNGTNFEALVTAISEGELCAEIPLLVVNNPGAVHNSERNASVCPAQCWTTASCAIEMLSIVNWCAASVMRPWKES